jgi:hypothetical protein
VIVENRTGVFSIGYTAPCPAAAFDFACRQATASCLATTSSGVASYLVAASFGAASYLVAASFGASSYLVAASSGVTSAAAFSRYDDSTSG